MAERPVLSASALCQPEHLKRWGVFPSEYDTTELDDVITDAINEATERIEEALRCKPFKATSYTLQAHDGSGSALLRLKHAPIISVSAVRFTGDTVDLDPSEYMIDASESALIRVTTFDGTTARWPLRRANVLVSYRAGFDPVPATIERNCARFAFALVLDRGRDPRSRTEGGANFTSSRTVVDPETGLPGDVWDGIKKYKQTLISAPAPRN